MTLAGCSFTLAQDVTPPPGYTPEATIAPAATASEYPLLPPNPENGKKIYENECATCHGSNGQGSATDTSTNSHPVIKEGSAAFTTSLVNWYDAITNHATNSTMPDFAGVVDERDRWDISAYLYLLNLPDGSLETGKAIYEVECILCHGEAGKGDGVEVASLSIQPPNFTYERILAPRSDHELFEIVSNGSSSAMPAYSAMLDSDQIKSVVSFVRTLSFSATLAEPTATVVEPTVSTTADSTDRGIDRARRNPTPASGYSSDHRKSNQ